MGKQGKSKQNGEALIAPFFKMLFNVINKIVWKDNKRKCFCFVYETGCYYYFLWTHGKINFRLQNVLLITGQNTKAKLSKNQNRLVWLVNGIIGLVGFVGLVGGNGIEVSSKKKPT